MPFLNRDIVQIFAVLMTKQIISQPGLSGFMETGTTGLPAYLTALLSFVIFLNLAIHFGGDWSDENIRVKTLVKPGWQPS